MTCRRHSARPTTRTPPCVARACTGHGVRRGGARRACQGRATPATLGSFPRPPPLSPLAVACMADERWGERRCLRATWSKRQATGWDLELVDLFVVRKSWARRGVRMDIAAMHALNMTRAILLFSVLIFIFIDGFFCFGG